MPVDTVVSQSSDQFYCLSVTWFLAGQVAAAERTPIATPKRVVPRPIR